MATYRSRKPTVGKQSPELSIKVNPPRSLNSRFNITTYIVVGFVGQDKALEDEAWEHQSIRDSRQFCWRIRSFTNKSPTWDHILQTNLSQNHPHYQESSKFPWKPSITFRYQETTRTYRHPSFFSRKLCLSVGDIARIASVAWEVVGVMNQCRNFIDDLR